MIIKNVPDGVFNGVLSVVKNPHQVFGNKFVYYVFGVGVGVGDKRVHQSVYKITLERRYAGFRGNELSHKKYVRIVNVVRETFGDIRRFDYEIRLDYDLRLETGGIEIFFLYRYVYVENVKRGVPVYALVQLREVFEVILVYAERIPSQFGRVFAENRKVFSARRSALYIGLVQHYAVRKVNRLVRSCLSLLKPFGRVFQRIRESFGNAAFGKRVYYFAQLSKKSQEQPAVDIFRPAFNNVTRVPPEEVYLIR